MDRITYFRLNSPYEGDITKNCALTGVEVDTNFMTLEGRDIKSVAIEDEKVVITLLNGTQLSTEKITDGIQVVKNIEFSFDEENGILTIIKDGEEQVIDGFVTTDMLNKKKKSAVNSTLVGNGTSAAPLGLSNVVKTGYYSPVKKIINKKEGQDYPSEKFVGDRYLTVEETSNYGCLYNYNGLLALKQALEDTGSEWRIPTKKDWDDMLNAVECNPEARNHNSIETNIYLGEIAGSRLKSRDKWIEENENDASEPCDVCTDSRGVDDFGFTVFPAGYANDVLNYMFYTERAYFWTSKNFDERDAYIKVFVYNKPTVLQDILASDNFLSIRLVKDFDGENYRGNENILDGYYPTVLMPSGNDEQKVWTSVNVAITSTISSSDYTFPNGRQDIELVTRYFINEWDGEKWLKKEMTEGEEVLVFETDTKENVRYRLINNELVDYEQALYDDVVEHFQPIIDDIEQEIVEVNEAIVNEAQERTAADQALYDELSEAISTETSNRTAADQALHDELSGALQNEINNREAADQILRSELTDAIQNEANVRADADDVITGKLPTSQGSSFDTNTGTLTVKSNNGTNDISIQFNMNFGSF